MSYLISICLYYILRCLFSFRSLFSGSIRALEERYGPAPPPNLGAAGAEAFSLWMAAVCPLSDYEKARLLKTTDTAERLRAAVGCFSTVMSRVSPAGTSGNAGVLAVHTDNDDEDDDNLIIAAAVDEEEVRPPRSRRSRRQPLRRPVPMQVPLDVTRQAERQPGGSSSTSPPELLISEIQDTVDGSEEMVTEEEDGNIDDEEEEQEGA